MDLRNICIIAHVDHGKTTLVDHILRQSGTFGEREQTSDRAMDSMDLERERGITIRAKNAAAMLGSTKVNIVDTPGHADFGGEVERILDMVDGSILLVDGAEGPLPQTRFVLQKALSKGHRIILVINKVDRPECVGTPRVQEVVDQTFNLFVDLGADDKQAEFPIIYAAAKHGWATTEWDEVPALINGEKQGSLSPLFKQILEYLPAPQISSDADTKMLVSNIGHSDFVGRLAIGKVTSGNLRVGQRLHRLGLNEKGDLKKESFSVPKLFAYQGMKQVETPTIEAGDIAVVAGNENFWIGDTITDNEVAQPLPRITIEEPTLAMIFSVNTSPFSGKDGDAIQSRKLRERLEREIRQNVALRFQDTDLPDQFRVLGRGELQFAILIEQMRREGSEFMVARPKVLYKKDPVTGEKLEPIEVATLDLPESYASEVTRMFQERKGILSYYEPSGVQSGPDGTQNRVRLEFEIPTRGLLGMRTKYLTASRGAGLFSSMLKEYAPFKGEMLHRNWGALISDRDGEANGYGLFHLEDRGALFIEAGEPVYEGMVIGEFNKENDLNVNPCREKKLTNVRASGSDEKLTLKGIRKMTLEKCIEWIDDDEWIEVTPSRIRIRKAVLKANQRSIIRRIE